MARKKQPDAVTAMLDELEEWVSKGVDEFRRYMASPEGRDLRKRVARALILGAPLIFRSKLFRTTPLGRVVGLLGGTAAVVKIAEALRDWEPAVDVELADS